MAAVVSADIEACKALLRSTRTPGRKLDGVRGAIQRCEKRAAKASQGIVDANALLLAASERHTTEQSMLVKFRSELQLLEEELAIHQSHLLFRETSPTQLPPEVMWQQDQMTQQIEALKLELAMQSQRAQQELATQSLRAQQALEAHQTQIALQSAQHAQMTQQMAQLQEALYASGQLKLAEMADAEPPTPIPTAACLATAEVEATPGIPVPVQAPHVVATPNGRRCVSKLAGYVPTPGDGSGLVGLGLESARTSPY